MTIYLLFSLNERALLEASEEITASVAQEKIRIFLTREEAEAERRKIILAQLRQVHQDEPELVTAHTLEACQEDPEFLETQYQERFFPWYVVLVVPKDLED